MCAIKIVVTIFEFITQIIITAVLLSGKVYKKKKIIEL